MTIWTGTPGDGDIDFQGGLIKIGDGADTAPGFAFTSDIDTGVYRSGANVFGIAVNGNEGLLVSGTLADGTAYLDVSPEPNLVNIGPKGSAANLQYYHNAKGTGAHHFRTAGTVEQARVTDTPSAVNYVDFTGGVSGSPGIVTVSAAGGDPDVDLALNSKGSGVLKFGSHSAVAAETLSGYITVKDSGGTSRKIGVIS